jgi:hypothetical protein
MDLADCLAALEDRGLRDLSKDEREDAIDLIKLCENIVNEFSDEVEEIEAFGVDDHE